MKSASFLSIALLLVILIFNSSSAQNAGQLSKDLNKFSIRLYKNILKKETSNLVFSPVSISSAFAQMYIGSRKNTQREMTQLFGFNKNKKDFEKEFAWFSQSMFTPPDSSTVELINANSIWVMQQLPVSETFISKLQKVFNTELFKVDFTHPEMVVSKVNQWASTHTKNKIQAVISEDKIRDSPVMLLLNAVYFKDKWDSHFNKSATRNDDFYLNASDKIIIPMMNTSNGFPYLNSGSFEAVSLPYKTKNYSMLILLPKKTDGLAALEDSLNKFDIAELMENLKPFMMELSMPSFEFEYEASNLKNSIMSLGMTDAFDGQKADFRDILANSSEINPYIQNVVQKAFIEVNEDGTEAAAVTTIYSTVTILSEPIRFYNLKIDHPFLFFIVEEKTKCIIFMGRCINPKG